jgi:uncharacterized protein
MNEAAIPLWHSLAGGALIGLAAAVLLLGNGRIAGISGITGRILTGSVGEQAWHVAFVAGLVLPALLIGGTPAALSGTPQVLAIAGMLVGYGTRIASGCTSGHGVAGVANLSVRSLVATLTFIVVAVVTVAARQLLAGSP